jgi:4a-hydroxytetrahydrobiopterin dehydratase
MAKRMTAAEVTAALSELEGWDQDGDQAISRTFSFSDHITAMGFVNRVAMVAEKMDHHPNLRIVYNTVDIELSTHDASGVTEKDIDLARAIERYA